MTDVLYFHIDNITQLVSLLFKRKTVILWRMKKEVILAISLGLFFGLLITLGLYRANSQKSSPESTTSTPSPSVSPTGVPALTITEPIDGSVFATASAILRGMVDPAHHVLIMDESTEYFTDPDKNGLFIQEISLEPGTNQIEVFVFDDKIEVAHQQINLVFTTSL